MAPSRLPSNGIAVIEVDSDFADRELLIEAAQSFYREHADDFDMLVLWAAPTLGPGHSFYLPVQNDVPGLGYGHYGRDLFDDSPEFGSTRLQGVIWMGPDWRAKDVPGSGPRSVLGTLAHETGHRWAASIQFAKNGGKPSPDLLGEPFHWSFFLDTGGSPLGGNEWVALGDSRYQAVPVSTTIFCDLELYLMGLLPRQEVPPVTLLVNPRTDDGQPDTRFRLDSPRVSLPVTMMADVVEVSVDQVIDVEGLRDSDLGFTAANIRQGWVYLVKKGEALPREDELIVLGGLRLRWDAFWRTATHGRGTMDTTLDPSQVPSEPGAEATGLPRNAACGPSLPVGVLMERKRRACRERCLWPLPSGRGSDGAEATGPRTFYSEHDWPPPP